VVGDRVCLGTARSDSTRWTPNAPEEESETAIYEFAVAQMKEAGMRVATVATGGDPGHAPARRAYRKAGFDLKFPSVWLCRNSERRSARSAVRVRA